MLLCLCPRLLLAHDRQMLPPHIILTATELVAFPMDTFLLIIRTTQLHLRGASSLRQGPAAGP